ncbi:NUDIX hydrolase [Candidatus Nanosalina sp. VS9-1]|uniref:NUDIX hydrolase n=1 Tax=Candidatus Nanosalina sp. VS9-1 TaxID=3388566 RepID=UPI0039E02399
MSEIPVAKVLIQKDDEFLAVKDNDGYWELPGGKIEEDEDRFEASRREVKEEVNLEIEGLEDVVRVEVEDMDCVNCWIMHTEKFSGDIDIFEDELQDWRWVTFTEYRDMNWHADSGYAIPAMRFLEDYLD